jgi:hypothetical protein
VEVLETRGVVTVPVERVIREGRVDVTVRRRILGVVPWATERVADVVDAGVASGEAGGRGSSRYHTETLVLRTRSGAEWRSASAAGIVGGSPGEAAERIRALLDGGGEPEVALWWVPVLEHVVGIPFTLVAGLLLGGLLRAAGAALGAAAARALSVTPPLPRANRTRFGQSGTSVRRGRRGQQSTGRPR